MELPLLKRGEIELPKRWHIGKSNANRHLLDIFRDWRDPPGIKLLMGLLKYNPAVRLTADKALASDYFSTQVRLLHAFASGFGKQFILSSHHCCQLLCLDNVVNDSLSAAEASTNPPSINAHVPNKAQCVNGGNHNSGQATTTFAHLLCYHVVVTIYCIMNTVALDVRSHVHS